MDLLLDDKLEVIPADAVTTIECFSFASGDIVFDAENHRGLAFQLWPACRSLCHFIETRPDHFWEGKRILEVGAGLGVASILLGRLGATVTATDLEAPCALIRENVRKNAVESCVKVEPLDWFKPHDVLTGMNFDYIVAADCIYWEELFEPLRQTLEAACSSNTEIILAQVRRRKIEGRFFKKMGKRFTCERAAGDFPGMEPGLRVSLFTLKLREEIKK